METEEKTTEQILHDALILRETNAKLISEIESMGGGVDLGTARLEHLISAMVEFGAISQRQAAEEQLKWERGLKEQLKAIRDRLFEMVQEANLIV